MVKVRHHKLPASYNWQTAFLTDQLATEAQETLLTQDLRYQDSTGRLHTYDKTEEQCELHLKEHSILLQ